MVSGNLAMIWAPNLLKCKSCNDPSKALEYSVKQMKFVRFLIEKWKIHDKVNKRSNEGKRKSLKKKKIDHGIETIKENECDNG